MDKNTPRNTKTSLWKRIIPVILGVFLALILIEAGLRLGGFIILSLREYRNIASAKQKGIYLIMCLGESTTADGPGPYPDQLENVLNQHNLGIKFIVVNEGVPTVNTRYILEHLKGNIDKYHPDMVVAMMGINDKYIKYYEGLQDADTTLFNTFKTYKFLRLIQKNILERTKRRMSNKANVQGQPDISQERLGREERKNLQVEKACQKAIVLDRNNTDAYAELGWLYMQERKYRQAEELFRQAVNLNSRNSQVYFGIGTLHKARGEYIQAEKDFEKTIFLDPGNDRACADLGWIYT